MMDLEKLKKEWQKQDSLGYDQVDLVEIFEARTRTIFSRMQSYLIKDIAIALILTALFVAILFILDVRNFYFWTTSLVSLALVNTIIFSFQTRLLYRQLSFEMNVVLSLKKTRRNLNILKAGSTLLSVVLAGCLALYYLTSIQNNYSVEMIMIIVVVFSLIAYGVALLINAKTSSLFIKKIDEIIREMEGNGSD